MELQAAEDKLKKLLFIVNPVSGKKAVLREMGTILGEFNRGGYLPEVYYTAKRGDATDFTRRFAGEFPLVCCAGGDGTLNEVISGLLSGGHAVPVGYIPCGSTNDFASARGLSPNLAEQARAIAAGERVRAYDVGMFNDSFFSYVAAFGAFCRVSYATDQNLKNIFGHTAYLMSGIRDLSNMKPVHAVVSTGDGRVFEDDYIFGAVSNSTSVGGTVSLPEDLVNPSDGLFEVLLIRMPKTIIDLNEIVIALLSRRYDSDFITFTQASEITVHMDTPYAWALDGEASPDSSDVHIRVLPGKLILRG